MAEDKPLNLFGFEIKRAKPAKKLDSIVPPQEDDGAGYVTASGSHYGQFINMEGDESTDNQSLIMKYRGVANHPEVDAAIEDICNESITSETGNPVEIILDEIDVSASIKKQIKEEFHGITTMLNMNENGHDIFKRWYIDGRLYYHLIVDANNPKEGIQEIRSIDACKIRKVKQVKKKKDEKTGASIIQNIEEFYIFQEKPKSQTDGVKISPDAISYTTSGVMSDDRKKVLSFLHKALKPINQLRMMEDSLVIYRLARAPERRIFYIDVGNLPRGKSEQYMKDIMARYRNKLVYDANTGQLKDDRKHMSMLEDFWLPRREGGRGTQIETLPGGENLGQIDDVIYFQKRLYRSLNVPASRLEQEQAFSLGRATEISREELKFNKFIERLRKKFAHLFYDVLKKQLILKEIITEEDWTSWKNKLEIEFIRDNHFTELRDAELMREKITTLDGLANYVGPEGFFSKTWIYKNVLNMDEFEIAQMVKEIEAESSTGEEQEPEPEQDQEQPDDSDGEEEEV